MPRSATRVDKKDAGGPPAPRSNWTVNEPGDRQEREADRIATRVTEGAGARADDISPAAPAANGSTARMLRRKCAACTSSGTTCPTCARASTLASQDATASSAASSPITSTPVRQQPPIPVSPGDLPGRLAPVQPAATSTVSGSSPALRPGAKGSSIKLARPAATPVQTRLIQRKPSGPGRAGLREKLREKGSKIDVDAHMKHYDKFFALAVVLRGGHPLSLYKRVLRAGEGKERGVFRGALQVASLPPPYPKLIQLPSQGEDILIWGDPAREMVLRLYATALMRWAGDHLQDANYLQQDPISVAWFLMEHGNYREMLQWAGRQPLQHEHIQRNDLLPGDVLAAFGETVATGLLIIGMVGLFVGAEIITAGQATWLLVGYAGYSGIDSYLQRREEIEKTGYDVPIPETVVTAAGDIVGVSQLIEGMTGKRLGTGEKLGSKRRSAQLGAGGGAVTTLLIGSRAYRGGQRLGRSWRLSMPAKTPAGPYGAIPEPIPAAEAPTVPSRNASPGPVEAGIRARLPESSQVGLDILIEQIIAKGSKPESALAKIPEAILDAQVKKLAEGYRNRVARFRDIKSMEARAGDDPLNPRLKHREWRDNIEVRYENKPPSDAEITQAQELARSTGEQVRLFGDTPAGHDFPGIDGTIGIPPRPLSLKNAAPEWARWHAQEAIAKAAEHGYSKVTVHLRVRGQLADVLAHWDLQPPRGQIKPTFGKGIIAEILVHADDGGMSMAPPKGPPLVPPAFPGSDPGDDKVQRSVAPAAPRGASSDAKGTALDATTQRALDGLGNRGRPLGEPERAYFEPRFGQDLGNVRIHAGAHGANLSRELSARAFTAGSHIAFAPGEYAPHSESGRKLLAHELVHVVQQRRAGRPRIARQTGGSTPQFGLKDLITADDLAFRSPPGATELQKKQIDRLERRYQEYRGEKPNPLSASGWALAQSSGQYSRILVGLLGPDYRKGTRGPIGIDYARFERPASYSAGRELRDLQTVQANWDAIFRRLSRLLQSGIRDGKVNIGHWNILKGAIAEALSLELQQRALQEVRREHPNARLFTGVRVQLIRGGKRSKNKVEFSDNLIGSIIRGTLQLHRVIEVKSGRKGGAEARAQFFKFIEKNLDDGIRVWVEGIEEPFVYDHSSGKSTVTGLAQATRQLIVPAGTEHLGRAAQDQINPRIRVIEQALPHTPEDIEFLTRTVLEVVAHTNIMPPSLRGTVARASLQGLIGQSTTTTLRTQLERWLRRPLRVPEIESRTELLQPATMRRIIRDHRGLVMHGGRLQRLSAAGQQVRFEGVPIRGLAAPRIEAQRQLGAPATPGTGRSRTGLARRGETSPTGQDPYRFRTGGLGTNIVPPNVLNLLPSRSIEVDGRTIPPSATRVRVGDYLVVGGSAQWAVRDARTLRPVAVAPVGGEWLIVTSAKGAPVVFDPMTGEVFPPRALGSGGRTPRGLVGLELLDPLTGGQGAGGARSGPRLSVKVGASVGALWVVAGEVLAGAARSIGQARANIANAQALFDYWVAAGADPTYGIYTPGKEPYDALKKAPEANVWDSVYPYVADIDVDALDRELPKRLHDYQEFVAFLDAGIMSGAIAKEDNRFYVIVNAYKRSAQIVYDITNTIEKVRRQTISKTDASMRDRLRSWPKDKLGRIRRLKKGNRTPFYRSAHGQPILSSFKDWGGGQLAGPDPWVIEVGPKVGWSLRFAHKARVMVAPANADAWRGALNSAYLVNESIEDTLKEVQAGGRPILSKVEEHGRLVSFHAGPDSGPEARFGKTHYRRQPGRELYGTVAVGELKRFWVKKDDLTDLGKGEAERYAEKPSPSAD